MAASVLGCQPDPNTTADATASVAREPATAAVSATSQPIASASSAAPATELGAPTAKGPFTCGSLTCQEFDSPIGALKWVLETDKPLIVSIGESHAQKGSEAVKSVTARFTDDFLPELGGKASSMVVELWVADGTCGKVKEKAVAEQQKEVTKTQSESNPNEFVKLGEKSRSLQIVPFPLRPTCAEYDKIQKAGKDAPLEMLSMITRLMREKATSLFKETEKKKPGQIVLTYGGSMHNDRTPKKGLEEWSFAADLDKVASGRYTELDLVVPEFIKDNATWQGLPWFSAYDQEKFAKKTILITMSPRSYALFFPRSDQR